MTSEDAVPEIDLTNPDVLVNPFAAYATARGFRPVARLTAPGLQMWAVLRHEEARAMLNDPRFEVRAESFMRPPGIPEHCLAYMRTLSERDGPDHKRLRRLVTPAFSAKRAAEFRPRIQLIVDRLLDDLAVTGSPVDLIEHFAQLLPIEVICELVGIPLADRPQWIKHAAVITKVIGSKFAEAVPAIIDGAKAAVARRRAEPADDLLARLIEAHDEDGDRLSDTDLIMMTWQLVLAGQTPANLIANAVAALLTHPDQLADLRANPDLMPVAVEELTRWCSPQLLTAPRFAREDVEIGGVLIKEGERVTAAMAAANRDPQVFPDPDRLDIRRTAGLNGHLAFAHGPHFCLGASLSRVEMDVALTSLLRRFPELKLAVPPGDLQRAPDGGTWRLAALPVVI